MNTTEKQAEDEKLLSLFGLNKFSRPVFERCHGRYCIDRNRFIQRLEQEYIPYEIHRIDISSIDLRTDEYADYQLMRQIIKEPNTPESIDLRLKDGTLLKQVSLSEDSFPGPSSQIHSVLYDPLRGSEHQADSLDENTRKLKEYLDFISRCEDKDRIKDERHYWLRRMADGYFSDIDLILFLKGDKRTYVDILDQYYTKKGYNVSFLKGFQEVMESFENLEPLYLDRRCPIDWRIKCWNEIPENLLEDPNLLLSISVSPEAFGLQDELCRYVKENVPYSGNNVLKSLFYIQDCVPDHGPSSHPIPYQRVSCVEFPFGYKICFREHDKALEILKMAAEYLIDTPTNEDKP